MPELNPAPSQKQAVTTYIREPYLDVRDFGAKFNGANNDQPAIQAAVNAANANGGGIVFCPPGTAALLNGIQLLANVTICGSGMFNTIFKTVSGYAAVGTNSGIPANGQQDVIYAVGNGSPALQNPAVTDLTVDATFTTASASGGLGFYGAGISFVQCDYAVAERVRVLSSASFGIQLGSNNPTTWLLSPRISYCILDSCGTTTGADSIGGGVHTGGRILYNKFINCYGTAWDNLLINDCVVHGNIIYSPQNSVGGAGRIQSDLGMSNSVISNNVFAGGTVGAFGAFTDTPQFGTPTGGILLGGGSGTSSHPPTNVAIIGNVFFGSQVGICVESAAISGGPIGSTCHGIIIEGNVINTVWGITDPGPTYDRMAGIELYDADGCLISGNHITDWNANLAAISNTIAAGVVTAASRNAAIFFGAASSSSNGVTNTAVRGNTLRTSGNHAAQSEMYVEMQNSFGNLFEDNVIETPISSLSVVRTTNGVGGVQTKVRNNTGLTWSNTTLSPNTTSFPLPTSATPSVNNSGLDLAISISGGTVSNISFNGISTGQTSGVFSFPLGTQLTITYTVAPTLISWPTSI